LFHQRESYIGKDLKAFFKGQETHQKGKIILEKGEESPYPKASNVLS